MKKIVFEIDVSHTCDHNLWIRKYVRIETIYVLYKACIVGGTRYK